METPMRESQQALKILQHIKPMFGVDILVYKPDVLIMRIQLGDSFL